MRIIRKYEKGFVFLKKYVFLKKTKQILRNIDNVEFLFIINGQAEQLHNMYSHD